MNYSTKQIQAVNRAFGWFDGRKYTVTYWVAGKEFIIEIRGYDRLRQTTEILDNLNTQYLVKGEGQ